MQLFEANLNTDILFYSVVLKTATIFTSGSRPREVWEPLHYITDFSRLVLMERFFVWFVFLCATSFLLVFCWTFSVFPRWRCLQRSGEDSWTQTPTQNL